MKKLACRYAIVQFLPYTETGEFANVGVVLACPTTGYFNFKLETRRYARYTHFFRELDKLIYLRAIAALRDEMERMRKMQDGANAETVRDVFTALVHPREAILRFGEPRALLAEEPAQALEQLYGHYVEHDFVTHEYREKVLEQRVQQLIKGLNLENPFKEEKLGDDEFAVRFPLVQTIKNKPAKVIKPFFLAQEDTMGIYNHGDVWLGKLKRLRKHNQLPERVLFTLEAPDVTDDKRYKAFDEMRRDLHEYAETALIGEEAHIVKFAKVG